MTLACLRGLLGGALLLFLFFNQVKKILHKELILKMMIPAFFGVILNQILFLEGLKRSTPLHAAVLANTIPVFSTLLAVIFGFEKRSGYILFCIILGSICSSLFILSSGQVGKSDMLWGDLLIFGNVLSIAVSYIFFKKWVTRVDPRAYTAFALTFAGLFFLSFKAKDVIQFLFILPDHPKLLIYTLYEIFVATSLAYLLNFYALTKLSVSTVTVFIFIQPIITEYAATLMGQPAGHYSSFEWILFLGIILSVCLILWEKRKIQRN